jgi:VIT1/CCC1 family predicted Fe2+/Mn2+ transporter
MMTLFEHLSPGEQLGEVLFGLIMTLTFTLGAGVMVGTSEGASSSLLYATLGCNVAWGIIDGALLLLGRMFDRGRLARLGDAIASALDEHSALTVVAQELDDMLVPVTSERQRLELYRDVVAHVQTGPRPAPRLAREDFLAAFAVFVLVFGATFPAALPYFLIHDAWVAQRASNVLLIGVLFYFGYRWAQYTSFRPLVAALVVVGGSVALVSIAIALGG